MPFFGPPSSSGGAAVPLQLLVKNGNYTMVPGDLNGYVITDVGAAPTQNVLIRLPPIADCLGKGPARFLASRPNCTQYFSIYANGGDSSAGLLFEAGTSFGQFSFYASDKGNSIEFLATVVNEVLLAADGAGNFANKTPGQTITGAESEATANLLNVTGDYLWVDNVVGTFQNGETLNASGGDTTMLNSDPISMPNKWVAMNIVGNWVDRD